MQKAEEYTGKQKEENTRLEEPFAIEVCPQFFDLSHRLLSRVLSPWLSSRVRGGKFDEYEEQKMDESQHMQEDPSEVGAVNMYTMLQASFREFEVAVLRIDGHGNTESHAQSSTTEYFSPDDMCVAILQVRSKLMFLVGGCSNRNFVISICRSSHRIFVAWFFHESTLKISELNPLALGTDLIYCQHRQLSSHWSHRSSSSSRLEPSAAISSFRSL